MAAQQPHTMAVVFPHGRDSAGNVSYTHYTYQQLDQRSDLLAVALQNAGVKRGVRTVLMVKPSLEFFALTFALFKIGAVPVMIDPGMGVKNLGQCLKEAEPEVFIGIPKAHLARRLFGWARGSLKTCISVGKSLLGERTLEHLLYTIPRDAKYPLAETRAKDVAAILFTSGSTGIPKGAVYTHGIFVDQVEKIRRIYGIKPGEIDLPTFPLFALFAPALGMTAIIPDMDATRPGSVDPMRIIEAVENFGVTNMFGSPALINRVGRYGAAHGVKLSSLRRVISAGAPVPAVVLERFSKMLSDKAQIFTPYGATECLPVASIGSREIIKETQHATAQGKGVCVGKPLEDLDVRVIKISDEPIAKWDDEWVVPDGSIGEIVVRGANVTREYFHREESTKLAKIPCGDTFFHRMGDLGYYDERGRLWFCGRKAHRVIAGNQTFFTIPCEAIFNTHPQVFRSALVGVERNGKTEPVMCVELEAEHKDADQERLSIELMQLGQSHELTKPIKTLLFHPSFPVDIRHNAKIFREKLAVWAKGQMGA